MEKENLYIPISRKLFSSADWLGDEPFDSRSAWIDLLSLAAYKHRMFRFMGKYWVELQRGQAVVTLRFLADRWHWGTTRIRTFLQNLVADGSIGIDTTFHAYSVITLHFYDKYNWVPEVSSVDTMVNTVDNTDISMNTSNIEELATHDLTQGVTQTRNIKS